MAQFQKIKDGYVRWTDNTWFKIVYQSDSVSLVNYYCQTHPNCGVLTVVDGVIYVCDHKPTSKGM